MSRPTQLLMCQNVNDFFNCKNLTLSQIRNVKSEDRMSRPNVSANACWRTAGPCIPNHTSRIFAYRARHCGTLNRRSSVNMLLMEEADPSVRQTWRSLLRPMLKHCVTAANSVQRAFASVPPITTSIWVKYLRAQGLLTSSERAALKFRIPAVPLHT